MRIHEVVFLLLMLFLVGVSPVAAEIIPIDPTQPPEPILTPAELEKLAHLQATRDIFLYSEVSPDDGVIVVAVLPAESATGGEPEPPQVGLLNIQDGSLQPIDLEVFLGYFPQTEVVWRDTQTALYLSSDQTGTPVVVTLDRSTGALTPAPLELPGMPLSLAPNGTQILVEMPAEDGVTLAAFDLGSEDIKSLLTYPQGGGPSHIAWTPDASKVAFVRTVLPPDLVADPEKIMELATQDTLGTLPLAKNPFFRGNIVEVFDLTHDEPQPATLKAVDGDGYLFKRVNWSTDGQTLLAQMVRPSQPEGRRHPTTFFPDRAYYRFYDANLTQIGTLDRPETEPVLSASSLFVSPDEVIITAPVGPTYRLLYYNRASGAFHILRTEDGTFADAPRGHQVYATHQSRQLIFNHSSFERPAEVYRIGLDSPARQQALTQFNATAAAANQVRVDKVRFRLDGGVRRVGYLVQPAGAAFPPRDVPVVLYQQGGPGGAMTNRWGATSEEPFNLLPNFGTSVLLMPLSGREGFGPRFFNALADGRNFGQIDIDEAAQAVQYMVRHRYTSPDRVGIAGCSYGGYFTAQSITRHPDVYAAANAQCSPLDLIQWWESVGRLLITYVEGRVPSEDPAEYQKDSPLYQAATVRTPTLMFHGTEDFLPVDTAASFHDAIEATGTPVHLLTFQYEGHGLSSPVSKFVAAQWQIHWFRQHLAG